MQNTLKKTDFERTFKALKRGEGFLSAISWGTDGEEMERKKYLFG